jgi:hypothetical protein
MVAGVAATLAQSPVSATVTGQVVSAVTGAPMAGAEIFLNRDLERPVSGDIAAIPGAQRKTVTGEDGRFIIDNVPAGKYYLFASKPGFFWAGLNDDLQPGASDVLVVGWPGPPVITLKLRPHGAITGRVTDDEDKPVAGAKVRALSKRLVWPSWGQRWAWDPLMDLGAVVTDENGHYVIEAVKPGDYLVQVDADKIRIPGTVRRTFGTTYSPGSPDLARALPFHLGMGERRFADVRLTAKPAFDLSGFAGAPANESVFVQLFSIDDVGEEHRRQVAEQWSRNGEPFTFTNLPAGEYVLAANINDRFWGEQRIRIDDRSLTDVHLRLPPAIVVSGRIVWEGAAQPPDRATLVGSFPMHFDGYTPSAEEVSRLRAQSPIALAHLSAVGRSRSASGTAAVWASETTFTVTTRPGRFLAGHGNANGWLVKSFRINGHEATDEPVDIDSNSTDAVLTLTRALGEVQGTVVTSAGGPDKWCPVVLFSTNRRVWPGLYAGSRVHIFKDRSDDSARFTIQGVLPGEYYLAAITWAEMENLDLDLLGRLAGSAARIQVPAGVPVSRTLTRTR